MLQPNTVPPAIMDADALDPEVLQDLGEEISGEWGDLDPNSRHELTHNKKARIGDGKVAQSKRGKYSSRNDSGNKGSHGNDAGKGGNDKDKGGTPGGGR